MGDIVLSASLKSSVGRAEARNVSRTSVGRLREPIVVILTKSLPRGSGR